MLGHRGHAAEFHRGREIEALKARSPRAGQLLAQCRDRLDESISAILTFNTIANTLGSFVYGMLAGQFFPKERSAFAAGMTIGLLIFGEILPKNIGVTGRKSLFRVGLGLEEGVTTVRRVG